MGKSVFSILVANHYGVLTKVAGVFARRACNIQSLTVCETLNPAFSRVTVVAEDSEETIRQVYNQTSKLEDVRDIALLAEGQYYERTLALIRLNPGAVLPLAFFQEKEQYIAVRDFNGDILLEIMGPTHVVDALIECLRDDIIDLSRSGSTALASIKS